MLWINLDLENIMSSTDVEVLLLEEHLSLPHTPASIEEVADLQGTVKSEK